MGSEMCIRDMYTERYGVVASAMNGRNSIFGALVFRTDNLDKARASGTPLIDEANRVVIREENFDSILEFIG